ncbi:MAG: hypothetical protein PHT54_01970 [Candidatus Nanoarchaeia archaeon]|nr:hypothetical protein [Candidatus Nanoarchaeia archaeon]
MKKNSKKLNKWYVALIFLALGVLSGYWIPRLIEKSTPNNTQITQKLKLSLDYLAAQKNIRVSEVVNMIEYQWKKEDMQRQFSSIRAEVEKKKHELKQIESETKEAQTKFKEAQTELRKIQYKINRVNKLLQE